MKQKFTILFIIILTNISLITAQSTRSCSVLVEQALSQMGTNCANLDSNSACYGHLGVNAEFIEGADVTFEKPSDRALLTDIVSITTDPLDEETGEWGISVMRLTANLPNSLPGQGVVFIMMGDAQLTNDVTEENVYTPDTVVVVEIASNNGEASLLSFPPEWGNRQSIEVGIIADGETLETDAVSEDGQWLRVHFVSEKSETSKRASAWINIKDIVETDFSELAIINPSSHTPMQAFTVETGFGESACEELPPSQLIIQGPSTIEVDLTANGLDFRLTSTVKIQITRNSTTSLTPVTGSISIPDPNYPDNHEKAINVAAGQFVEVPITIDEETDRVTVDPVWKASFAREKAKFDKATENGETYINENEAYRLGTLEAIPKNVLYYSLKGNTPVIISPSGLGNPTSILDTFTPTDQGVLLDSLRISSELPQQILSLLR